MVELKITSVGAVLAPREPILDIVPENPVLLVEARVRPEDISYVRIDSTADVRLTGAVADVTATVRSCLRLSVAGSTNAGPGLMMRSPTSSR